jgi:hypothetical protein
MQKPEGKRQIGKPEREREYTIKADLRKTGLESVDWMNLGKGRSDGLFELAHEN